MKKLIFLLLLLFSMSFCGCGKTSYLESKTAETKSDAAYSEEQDTEQIYVQIDGAVKKPGVYKLPADSRVFLLIEKAGGLNKDAADSELNLAELLTDGQKLTVLTKKELKEQKKTAEASGTKSDGKVDINRADQDTLTTISGIGPSRAAAIFAYREENGPFKKTEDITNVSGIGDSTYQRIKDKITV